MPTGVGQDSDIIAGVVWAVDHGADVINMSFSSPGYSPALQAAIDYAWANDVVLVAATGNDGSSVPTFPAGDRGVIGVSNTDQTDALDASSNYGADTFLGAPGVGHPDHRAGRRHHLHHRHVRLGGRGLRGGSPAARSGSVCLQRRHRFAPGPQRGRGRHPVDQTGNGRLNLGRAIDDNVTDYLQPNGAGPLGSGGPFVGPYSAAAVVFGSFATADNGGATTSVNVAKPTSTVSGDFLLAQILYQNGTSVATLTPPSGWTLVRRTDNGTALGQAIYYRFAGGSEPTSYTWTFSSSTVAAGGIARYTGVDPTTPFRPLR